MEFFRDSKIDFIGARRLWLTLSLLLVLASMVVLGLGGLNLGIDFTGGTQVTVRFAEEPRLDELRSSLESAGIQGAQIQRFGDPGSKEIILKTPMLEGSPEGSQSQVVGVFDQRYNVDTGSLLDLNQQGSDALASLLARSDPDSIRVEGLGDSSQALRQHYEEIADAVIGLRKGDGLLESWEQIGELEAVSPAALSALRSDAVLGKFSVLAAESVGSQIGSELRVKGILAVVFSMIGMLAYIWLRFELRFGIGALVALLHDVLISLGLYAIFDYEFNLTSIAAFLTVVGYSVNDSVVVFDRVRENLRRNRREPLSELLNRSINQTLSRTVLTSGTTLAVVVTLFLFGGDVIRGLAFVLMVGVVVGTYSSIFIASPTVLVWERWFGREARARRTAQPA